MLPQLAFVCNVTLFISAVSGYKFSRICIFLDNILFSGHAVAILKLPIALLAKDTTIL